MRLLFDSHLPAVVAEQLRLRGVDAVHLREWHDGALLHASDRLILQAAHPDQRTLLTSDRRTVEQLLSDLVGLDEHHAGVVFVDAEAFTAGDRGRLLRAVLYLLDETAAWGWTDRVTTLRPVG